MKQRKPIVRPANDPHTTWTASDIVWIVPPTPSKEVLPVIKPTPPAKPSCVNWGS